METWELKTCQLNLLFIKWDLVLPSLFHFYSFVHTSITIMQLVSFLMRVLWLGSKLQGCRAWNLITNCLHCLMLVWGGDDNLILIINKATHFLFLEKVVNIWEEIMKNVCLRSSDGHLSDKTRDLVGCRAAQNKEVTFSLSTRRKPKTPLPYCYKIWKLIKGDTGRGSGSGSVNGAREWVSNLYRCF